jgi:ABC-type sugar transport system ATPase subunit
MYHGTVEADMDSESLNPNRQKSDDTNIDPSKLLIRMQGMTKKFTGVTALDHVDFELRPGEVHALIGENGAGKSTLVKILAGAYQPDGGTIEVNGQPVNIVNPQTSQQLGIAFIFQELSVVNGLSVAENIMIGQEPKKGLFYDFQAGRKGARQVLAQIGFEHLNPDETVKNLSVAEKQGVMIAKALYLKANVVVMDEATSSLDGDEVDDLFEVIRNLRSQGKSIIYVSHRMSEVFQIADRVTVFKDGKKVGTENIKDVTERDLVRMMVGRQVNVRFPPKSRKPGKVVLKIENLENQNLRGISLELREGEVLAIGGLVGSGRTELLRAIFGVDKVWDGKVTCEGRNSPITSAKQAIEAGIALVPEDRLNQGIVARQTVSTNLAMIWTQFPQLHRQEEKEATLASRLVDQLQIKTPSIQQVIAYLSGGNQQKVVVAKWLAVRSKVMLLDEPTRGIDVGAKLEMYNLIDQLAHQGMAVILVSSELPEVCGMADRILVMRGGRIVGELSGDATEEEIMEKSMLTQEVAA